MSVEPDHQARYIRRHNPIWRDLAKVLLDRPTKKYLGESARRGKRSMTYDVGFNFLGQAHNFDAHSHTP